MDNERKFAVVEKIFDYKGHECICIFNRFGHRCGYVSVDFEPDYKTMEIDCHKQLTFGGKLPYDYGQSKEYYIGFDCGHYCDKNDLEQSLAYGLIDKEEYSLAKDWELNFEFGIVRSLNYVKYNCKNIVDQLENK